ncbi:protein SPIRAL1-like 2 [Oryza brachyantha]|uniref:Protein SPIRAL1-like 3 n=1 Tax=Oryza brachyantha TaxID=4533 RepID=J3N9Q1_ORYBR|nr:protein SPIRAL1-like 2 [Oryza brachyantha]
MGRGRGVSSRGGQSSLGYLFGGGEVAAAAKPKPKPVAEAAAETTPSPVKKTSPAPSVSEKMKEIPAGIQSSQSNNYFRAQGQNCGNFLTERPSTKVHAAPGGGSSLDYLFGGAGGK